MVGTTLRRGGAWLGVTAGVAGVYLGLALLGLRVVVVGGQVSPVWPATGFALVAAFLLGARAWPGLLLGSLLATATTGASGPVVLGIAAGNLLEAVLGAALLRRVAFQPQLERMRDVLALVLGPALVATLASAGVGALSLCLAGIAPWSMFPRALGIWWVGDAMGALVLAPVLFAWRSVRWSRLTPREVDERAVLLVLLVASCTVVFGQHRAPVTGLSAQAFLLFPFTIWAGLRLRAPEAALVTLLISAGATVGTALGLGPFASRPPLDGVLVLQLFIGVLALTSLLLNAARVEGLAASAQLALLAAAVRSTEEGVLILEPVPGRGAAVLFANRGFCHMSGWTERALQQGGLALLRGASTPEDFLPRLEYAVREGGSFSGEAALRRGDGSDFVAELQLSPVEGPGGADTQVVATVRDVTRRRRMQSQLALSERMASVGRLAAGVAHEVNTPLAYLLTHLDALGRQLAEGPLRLLPQAPALRESVARAREGGERVRRIVGDLRVFAREGREERARVDLNAVVETALTLTRNELSHRASVLETLGGVPPVEANRARLEQVLVNLLMNAAQSIPEGSGAAHTVEVRTGRDVAGRAQVVVRDSGQGIAPEHLPRIFEPFFTTKPVGEGTGLGLAICHEIITGLGGDIAVESAPGRGTAVTVTLPAAAEPQAAAAPQAAAPAPTPAPPPAAPGRRAVLVVDDEVRMGLSIQLLLQPDHDVTTTTSAQEALAWLTEGRTFDVILCDLQMPHMSGMELYARLREVAPGAAERVVFLTGGAFTSAAREFVRTVQNRVLEKPVPPDVLLETIAAAPLLPRSVA